MRSLPPERWPKADQEAWDGCRKPSVRLTRGGRASHMRWVTQADLARRYGYLLDHLDRHGLLDESAAAAASVTPEAIASLIAEGQLLWRPVTLAQTIYKLRRMAEILDPRQDLSWLVDIERDLALEAHPKPRFERIVTSEQLVEDGLTLVIEARDADHRRQIWRATMMRNGLMIALLALCPIRRRNFAGLRLQESFRREGERWWIVLGRGETKSGRPDERPVPGELNRAIALYLTWARPILLHLPEFTIGDEPSQGEAGPWLSGALWAGEKGEPLLISGVERAIAETTRLALGVALRPHDFRRCAAATAAFRAGTMPHLASALLQHTDRRVTDQYYNRASSMQANAAYATLVADMRERG